MEEVMAGQLCGNVILDVLTAADGAALLLTDGWEQQAVHICQVSAQQ